MKRVGSVIAAIAAIAWTAPDASKTPGATVPGCSVVQICQKGYAAKARAVPDSLKRRVCLAYGVTKACPGPAYEIDHLISLELCGSNDQTNLWPQPIAEAHEKDKLEDRLHAEVCAGKVALKDAEAQLQAWGRQ